MDAGPLELGEKMSAVYVCNLSFVAQPGDTHTALHRPKLPLLTRGNVDTCARAPCPPAVPRAQQCSPPARRAEQVWPSRPRHIRATVEVTGEAGAENGSCPEARSWRVPQVPRDLSRLASEHQSTTTGNVRTRFRHTGMPAVKNPARAGPPQAHLAAPAGGTGSGGRGWWSCSTCRGLCPVELGKMGQFHF